MRIGFFIREATRSMRRNAVPSFAAISSVLVTVLVLGVFIPVVQATNGAANDIRGRILVDAYLRTDATPADVARVRALLLHTRYVGKVDFISKSQAFEEEFRRNPAAYRLLGRNPLPDTFRITPDRPEHANALRNVLSPVAPTGQRTTIDPAIDNVRNKKDETNKILTVTRIVKLALAALAGLLVIASVLLIANTIRLSLFARRREVEVMKLVGATDWFIRWPFVIEGIVLGALGGALAIALLLVGKLAVMDPLSHEFAIVAAPRTVDFQTLALILTGASIAVASAGSGLSLRRFLRV
jgi:cell division transport system permease protein